jgi:uncharacterized protein (DUF1800 family)
MYLQNVLLLRARRWAISPRCCAVSRDPAMLVYLDNAGSRRRARTRISRE